MITILSTGKIFCVRWVTFNISCSIVINHRFSGNSRIYMNCIIHCINVKIQKFSLGFQLTIFFFRDGANEIFQDAVGEMISLAGSTPKYLHSLGLISNEEFREHSNEADINFLMNQVCQIMSFLKIHSC